jgi:hypothetical protein
MKKKLLLAVTHLLALTVGFGAGVYFLPILTAPEGPSAADVAAAAASAEWKGEFRRNLKDSDFAHWGEGVLTVSKSSIALAGRVSPGPDYKLYLSPEFVETKADFLRLKSKMARVGDVKTFENFIIAVPAGIDPAKYSTVVVWCETFSMFISSARYR